MMIPGYKRKTLTFDLRRTPLLHNGTVQLEDHKGLNERSKSHSICAVMTNISRFGPSFWMFMSLSQGYCRLKWMKRASHRSLFNTRRPSRIGVSLYLDVLVIHLAARGSIVEKHCDSVQWLEDEIIYQKLRIDCSKRTSVRSMHVGSSTSVS